MSRLPQTNPCKEYKYEPSTLIIQLKRYEYDSEKENAIKRKDKIEHMKRIRMANRYYTLSSILNHFGDTPEEGHHNLVIYNESSDSFDLVDDTYARSEVQITSDMKTYSYIFVFEKNG